MSADKRPTREQEGPHHIADEPVSEPTPGKPKVRSPVTRTGLPVEDQIEKEWDNNRDGGLPTPLDMPRA